MQTIFDIIDGIEKEREKLGIDIGDLTKEAGIDRSTYQRWRNRDTSPQGTTLDKWCAAFARLKKRKARL